jgi:hypothetical protein
LRMRCLKVLTMERKTFLADRRPKVASTHVTAVGTWWPCPADTLNCQRWQDSCYARWQGWFTGKKVVSFKIPLLAAATLMKLGGFHPMARETQKLLFPQKTNRSNTTGHILQTGINTWIYESINKRNVRCLEPHHFSTAKLTSNKKFWEELIAYSSLIRHGLHRKRLSNNFSIVACVFVVAGTCLQSRCLATISWIHIETHSKVIS